ncbi:MAG: hypothetical protein JO314_08635 [Acidobacteria bacterium]|nr:hypothetical protein [Acidobacteriota bacterium]
MPKSVLTIAFLVFAANIAHAESFCDGFSQVQCSCGPIDQGMRFCVALTPAHPASKAPFFTLNAALENVIDTPAFIQGCRPWDDEWKFHIIGPSGDELLTDKEKAIRKKIAAGIYRLEDEIADLPIESCREDRIAEIAPHDERKYEFSLAYQYDFSEKGRYQIEITRRFIKVLGSSASEIFRQQQESRGKKPEWVRGEILAGTFLFDPSDSKP